MADVKDYTVLLLYPDYMADEFGHETYCAWVRGSSVKAAATWARREVIKAQKAAYPSAQLEDFHVLFVCRGHVKDLWDHFE